MRYGPGTETPIAGTGDPDPGTGAQTGYGPDMDVTPGGLAVGADGALLFSSGHVVSKLDDPAKAQPWSGTELQPQRVPPGCRPLEPGPDRHRPAPL